MGAPQLKSIKLLYNNLQTFDGYALNGTENSLRHIYLSRNSLRVIENGTFQLVPKLEVIDLYQNHLYPLTSGVFQELKNLEKLLLGMNKLFDLPEDIFKDLSSLVYLDLSNNSLSSLTIDLFVHMDHLMIIDLSGNRLVAIGNVLNLPNIRLDLCRNSLRQLGNVTLEILTNNIEFLLLEGNPWNCTCSLEPLRQWYQKLSIIKDGNVNIDNPICTHPNDLANQLINSLNFSLCHDIVAKSTQTSRLNVNHDDSQIRNTLIATDQMYQDVSGKTETSDIDCKLNVIIVVVVVAFVVIIVIVSFIILRVVLLKRRSNDIKANKNSESNGRGNWGGNKTSIQMETKERRNSLSEEEEEGDVNERTPLKRERNRGDIDLTPKERTCRKNLIEANKFIGAPQLKSIKLLYNNLQTFDRYALNGTENRLRNIYLSRSSLRVIENGTFKLVPKLEVIDLYQNHLSQLKSVSGRGGLESGVFQELKNLERLFLGMNKLLDLPEDIFKDLSSLVYLDLSNNSLSSLTIDLFVHMDHLMTIDFSGNRLVAIGNVLNLPNIRLFLEGSP
ncbi:protein artichoke-like [Strongylocentrotus purpuratus]|uniref:LRRCT domain-containing protein n=1 Tax=Strongylocentrotus purpuratus TaxID=7668 RepID=A0A7M7N5D7_STRPU|nr:protein artichoke-like [Strongylocentrotus purpuratus]